MTIFFRFVVLADADSFDHMSGWGGGWMWIWGVLMMALFLVFVVWLVRTIARPGGWTPRDPADRAREVLAERYAGDELSIAEYRERVSGLQ